MTTPPRQPGPVTSRHRNGLSRPPTSQGERRRRGDRRDGGFATLELTVLFPVVLLILFGVIQGALYFHGRNVAMAAAEQGVRAARTDGQANRPGTAADKARQFLAATGELNNLSDLRITPDVDADTVRVTVTGRTVSLLPGIPGPEISQTASGDIERFTNRGDR